MAEDGKFRIEKFDGTDFSWWKMQIEDLLVQKDLDVVLGDKPEKMSDADWASLDRKAMSVIRLSLTKNVAFNILKEKTAKGIMDALSNMYEKPSAANKVFLIRELSRGQNKVVCAREKPRATGQTQDERAWKGSRGPVRGICGSGSSRGASAKLPRRQWVRRTTTIPAVGTSLENFLLSMESVCSQDVPGSGSVRLQWEPVGTEDESGADFAVTDVLELGRASTGLSVV
ncbi:unnamed protein product [Cuscuta campestris]|uniref:Uncharacterized protein n=1 Tax=Cuscuta campestris TaxID=132261 RepID=A0A484MLM8_9ASTE|nr:unnamed protein product [Cuscuta campestris]